MKLESRNLEQPIRHDLEKKFVFLSGPRQVGKTTLARRIIEGNGGIYLLYDDDADREQILKKLYVTRPWVCLDEFHKFPRWKNHLKGVFDKYHDRLHLILTGSARLDVYQKSGDSLFGRYYLHHLHPLTVTELSSPNLPPLPQDLFEPFPAAPLLEPLMKFGGFPEPFLTQSENEHRRWSQARRRLLIREEMRDLSQVELLGLVEQLMLLLPERIGSLFSFRSLAEIVQVSPPTIQNWMAIFERLFIVFRVPPYTKKIARAIQKQPKFYLYDWSQCPDEGARFENLIASHLWKAVQLWTDLGEGEFGLHFVRDRDHREADFLVTRDRKPWFLVEAKLAETQLSEALVSFSRRLGIPGIQLVAKEGLYRRQGDLAVISASAWLGRLP